MRHDWEEDYSRRAGKPVAWEEDVHGTPLEVYQDRRKTRSTGKGLIMFKPSGVYYQTHHQWDNYEFDVLESAGEGAWVAGKKTGRWLRAYCKAHSLLAVIEAPSALHLRTCTAHSLCRQHRLWLQRAFLEHSLGKRNWTTQRIEARLRELAWPDEPVAIATFLREREARTAPVANGSDAGGREAER